MLTRGQGGPLCQAVTSHAPHCSLHRIKKEKIRKDRGLRTNAHTEVDSVTRCWSKKMPKFFHKLPTKYAQQSLGISNAFKISPKGTK